MLQKLWGLLNKSTQWWWWRKLEVNNQWRCRTRLAACDNCNCRIWHLLEPVYGFAGNPRQNSLWNILDKLQSIHLLKLFQVLVISLIQPIVVRLSQFSYVPSYESCCCSPRSRSHAFGGKHQHPRCHSVSVFPNRRIKGGIRNFVGQPWPAWAFIFVSRLLWAGVKKPSKPLAEGWEKQSDGCSCSVSLALIISLGFPWLNKPRFYPSPCNAHSSYRTKHRWPTWGCCAWKHALHTRNLDSIFRTFPSLLSNCTFHHTSYIRASLHSDVLLLLSVCNWIFLCNTLLLQTPMTFSPFYFLPKSSPTPLNPLQKIRIHWRSDSMNQTYFKIALNLPHNPLYFTMRS